MRQNNHMTAHDAVGLQQETDPLDLKHNNKAFGTKPPKQAVAVKFSLQNSKVPSNLTSCIIRTQAEGRQKSSITVVWSLDRREP